MAEPSLAERVDGSAALRRRQRVARGLARGLGRIETDGLDRVPARGPVILAVNHRSLMDGPLLFGFVGRPVACLVKSEAFVPVIGRLLLDAGQIPVVREQVDAHPVRLSLQILRAGGVVGVFPEGTRGDGTVRRAKPGVGYFALRTGATVVPVAVRGTAEMVRTPRRGPVRLDVGHPLRFEPYPSGVPLNRRLSAAATERVRVALAALVAGTDITPLGASA
jgi:1-acyl-sn-glycerol-3-phosphate acyltransferase